MVGAAGLLLATVLPLRGQGEAAAARIDSIGRSARIGRMRVNASFTLPLGSRLSRVPYVRVTNPRGEVEESLPMLFLGRDTSSECSRDLHSETYRPGVYQVQCELETIDGRAARVTVLSPATPLTIR
jgi:hypothetical protein